MKMMRLLVGCSVGGVVWGAVACSGGEGSAGDGSGGGATVVTSVEPSKNVASLDDADSDTYCRDLQKFVTDAFATLNFGKLFCSSVAAAFSSLGAKTDQEAQDKCRQAVQACNSSDAGAALGGSSGGIDAGVSQAQCSEFKAKVSQCNATVAEVNQCYADSIQALKTALSSLDRICDNARAPSDAGASSPPPAPATGQQPASCVALQQKCPQLSNGGGVSGGGSSGAGDE